MQQRIANKCMNELDLQTAIQNDTVRFSSLPLCVIDAIFSIGVKYASAEKVDNRYIDRFSLPPLQIKKTSPLLQVQKQHTMTQLADNIDRIGIDEISDTLFNRQRTSSRNGILKTEAVYQWAKILSSHGIEVLQDVANITTNIESELRSVRGQASGISLNYFYMLSGDDNLCKPDRWIIRFITDAIGCKISVSEAQSLLEKTIIILMKKYPKLSVRLLDNVIWSYMARRKMR